jgi:AhpD family alkylhydroperoxidase
MDKIDALIQGRARAHARLVEMKSPVYAAFLQLERATYQEGALSKRHKELIALGISVAINCESCMQWHIDQAARSGATEKEVLEALEVGIAMAGGPATAHIRFALDVMERVFESPRSK